MTLWAIFKNIGTIIAAVKALISLVKEVADKKSLPQCESIDHTMDAVEKLFSKNAVQIGTAKNEDIASAISQIRDQLKCKVP